jgi:hypothetical protein
MQIKTACGLTEPIKPECGAWGQGAEESPMGWLCLSWLSVYVNTKTPKPYEYTVSDTKRTKIIKTTYADDGNYMSRTHESAKSQATAISSFCTSTGIIVKPQRSYVYTNYDVPEENNIEIITYTGDGNFGLGTPTITPLKQIKPGGYRRHLGNVQTAMGKTTIHDVKLHDGSTYANILSKTQRNVQSLLSRAISLAAAKKACIVSSYRK